MLPLLRALLLIFFHVVRLLILRISFQQLAQATARFRTVAFLLFLHQTLAGQDLTTERTESAARPGGVGQGENLFNLCDLRVLCGEIFL
jgi:hypothetical protein